MTIQGELFQASDAVVPGLALVPDAVTAAEEAELAARIDAAPLEPFKFGQWRGKRLTAHYGRAYDFSRGRLDEAPPLPGWPLEYGSTRSRHWMWPAGRSLSHAAPRRCGVTRV